MFEQTNSPTWGATKDVHQKRNAFFLGGEGGNMTFPTILS